MKPHHIQLQVSIIVATSGGLSELENAQLDNTPKKSKVGFLIFLSNWIMTYQKLQIAKDQ
jgi:hypothetical protein